MLHQKATNRWALSKYALVLPLALILLAMTTAKEDMAAIVRQTTAETITVSGRVTSTADGKPLPGATVMIASSGKGTQTDAQGKYTLKQVPRKGQLSISFVGFTTQVIAVGGHSVIYAALAPTDPSELPTMGATRAYKAIKPNPNMPIRTPPTSETINGKVYTAVEEPAVFPTGIPGLMQYVAHTLQYPAKARAAGVQGNVLVEFLVLPSGAIGSARIKKGIGSGCDEEAIRIVKQMPRWIPAKQNGKSVATQFVLPIQFALEKKEDKRTGQIEPRVHKLTADEINDIPTTRDVNYPHQPMLGMVKAPTNVWKSDTTPQPGLMPKPVTPKSVEGKGPLGQLGSEPLYIVDGSQISGDSLKKLSPNSFDNLNVIKGASATATYGEKAKYGVIVITTKKK